MDFCCSAAANCLNFADIQHSFVVNDLEFCFHSCCSNADGCSADELGRGLRPTGEVPGAAQQGLVPQLQQPRGAGAEHGQGGGGGEDLPERGRGGEGRVRREGDGHRGLRGRGACVLREGSPDGGPREVAAAAAAFGAEHAAGAHPGGRRDEDRVHGRLGADEGEGHDHGGAPLLPGVRQLREDSSGARRARTVRAEAVRAVLREGADAVRGEAARAREGDDAVDEVVA